MSLEQFSAAGVIGSAAMHFADRVTNGADYPVALAAALAVQSVLSSNTCLDLDTAHEVFAPDALAPDASGDEIVDLDWPPPDAWAEALINSEFVASADAAEEPQSAAPLVLDGRLLFLRRFKIDEDVVAGALLQRVAHSPDGLSEPSGVHSDIADLFPTNTRDPENHPLRAAQLAMSSNLMILTGGPGTGKTHTLSRIIAALWRDQPGLDIALAAPTGKAATRMRDAIAEAALELDGPTAQRLRSIEPNTMHRLLGLRPGESPRHNRDNQLPHDVIVIDEASMISLPLMADLLNATRQRTRLILVGDPFQLASVEAGSVLGDLVYAQSALRPNVVELAVNYRSIAELDQLFQAVNRGDADQVMAILRAEPATGPIRWLDIASSSPSSDPTREATAELLTETICDHALQLIDAADSGDSDRAHELLTDTKVLCATRRGPLGLHEWTDRIESEIVAKSARHTNWYVGRPVMVTRNDYITGLLNGDTGITMPDGTVSFPDSDPGSFGTEQLSDIETWWAMTIHKSQGSEFRHAIVSLDGETRISSRELLYTALTRAKEQVTVVASEASIRATVQRRANRTSGLRQKLRSAE